MRTKYWITPVVEKDIPSPGIRYFSDQRRKPKPPSPWITFLQGLDVGDSFVTSYPGANSAMSYGKRLGILLMKIDLEEKDAITGMRKVRIWRVAARNDSIQTDKAL